jgi:hypothetical protein
LSILKNLLFFHPTIGMQVSSSSCLTLTPDFASSLDYSSTARKPFGLIHVGACGLSSLRTSKALTSCSASAALLNDLALEITGSQASAAMRRKAFTLNDAARIRML